MSDTEGDITLISKILLFNDMKAYSRLIQKHESSILSFLLSLTKGNMELSRDLSQDVFIKVHLNLASFRAVSKFSTWLFRIAYNCYFDYKKRTILERNASFNRSLDSLLDSSELSLGYSSPLNSGHISLTAISKEFLTIENDIDFQQLLNEFSLEDRAILNLYYISDFTTKKIASILNIKENSVKTKIKRSLEKLRLKVQIRDTSETFRNKG